MKRFLLVISILAFAGCDDPGSPEITPLYRYVDGDSSTQVERGSLQISEVNFAGSVSDDGTYDADDVFIELWNKGPRALNLSGLRIEVDGDYNRSYRIPPVDRLVHPNEFFIIARAGKEDGAFGEVADVFVENLELGKKLMHIELRGVDRELIEDAGSTKARVFTGGFDTYAVRTMERSAQIFGNRGGHQRSWHAFSRNVGSDKVSEGFRERTLASPADANSTDYSGNASSGNFE